MNSAKILVVEDERIVALDIAQRLRGLGYEVAGRAASAEQALALAAAERPDLVRGDPDRHLTRHLARGVPSHPVGHDEDPAVGEHEIVVFVARSNDADIGTGRTGEVHEIRPV